MTVTTERVYVREIPGGGFVAIDVTSLHQLFGPDTCRGEVLLERRAHPRDSEHPLVIAEATGPTMGAVLHQLIPTAVSNSAVAAALLAKHGRVIHESV